MQCRSFDMGVEKNNLGNSEYQTLKFNYRQFRRDSHVSDTSSFPTEGWRWVEHGDGGTLARVAETVVSVIPVSDSAVIPPDPCSRVYLETRERCQKTGHGLRMRMSYKWI